MTQIKYCIWDIGQTIYEYSLTSLHDYFATITTNPEDFKQRKGRFSYNEYMKGNVSWEKLCHSLSDYYLLNKADNNIIKEKFFEGIGEYFKESQKTINNLHTIGIKNGILSNALPVLSNTVNKVKNLTPECCFTSYDMGLLKPDVKIFQELLKGLNAKPHEVIFIDDKPKNIKAAQSIGINSIVYNKATVEQDVFNILKKSIDLAKCFETIKIKD